MLYFKTAIKNLLGNGLKTWLNVFVLSIAFVIILFMQSMLEGWNRQALTDTYKWEIGNGQYWAEGYDPYDPLTIDSSVTQIPLNSEDIVPILIAQATIYPQGRMIPTLLKGIPKNQKTLAIPTSFLENDSTSPTVVLGANFAKQCGLQLNDYITVRWRDKNGTFETIDARVAQIFTTTVPSVDNNQLWIDLLLLQKMTLNRDRATVLIKSSDGEAQRLAGWQFKSRTTLTKSINDMIAAKSVGMVIYYLIFIFLALIAIFDTQALAIFRRQGEIGTLVALGMTPGQVQRLFVTEGALYAFLSVILGTIYGLPIFIYYSAYGIPMPTETTQYGIAISETIKLYFTPQLVVATILFLVVITSFVGYLPARKIVKIPPTEAIRGKAM